MDGTERDMLQFVVYQAESGNDIKWTTGELDSERAIWQLLPEFNLKNLIVGVQMQSRFLNCFKRN